MQLSSLWLASAMIWSTTFAQNVTSYFFPNVNQTSTLVPGISANCSLALSAPVPECYGQLLSLLGNTQYYTIANSTVMDLLCRKECPTALTNYRTKVVAACKNDPQPKPGYPATHWVDAVTSVQTQMCLKDSKSGIYCTQYFEKNIGNATSPNDPLGGYTDAQLCSECLVNLFKFQQSTPYSSYDPDMALAWASIQKKCSLSLPTATQTLKTNVTSLGNYAPPGYPTSACVAGRNYTVVSGDNCIDISKKYNVSTGGLITVNSLRMDCTNIFVGQTLCLPPACNAYVVQSGDTCVGIANITSTSFQQISAWNPTINAYCTNLIAGQNICVGPPGGVQNFTTIAGASVTKTASYGASTASRPSAVATGTTNRCAKYYLVQPGDYCEIVALNNTVTLPVFLGMNPQINSTCGNLLSGVNYCVLPTQDWNSTATSTVVAPPTATPSGTTSNCYQWYTVQSGDYCQKIQDQFTITFNQLQGWNPSLANDCSNLQLGLAYCVNGAQTIAARATEEAQHLEHVARHAHGHAHHVRRRHPDGPVQTPSTIEAGGVPVGWPHIDNPRMRKAMGLPEQRDELRDEL